MMNRGEDKKTMSDQITTVIKLRLISQIDKPSKEDMRKVERAVKVQLGLSGAIENLRRMPIWAFSLEF